MDRICTVLASLRDCPSIRDVALYQELHGIKDLWEVLEDAMIPMDRRLARLTHLTKVTVGFLLLDPTAYLIEEYLRINFPEMHKRGILHLCFRP